MQWENYERSVFGSQSPKVKHFVRGLLWGLVFRIQSRAVLFDVRVPNFARFDHLRALGIHGSEDADAVAERLQRALGGAHVAIREQQGFDIAQHELRVGLLDRVRIGSVLASGFEDGSEGGSAHFNFLSAVKSE